ncbi:MAG: amidohydrolase family protein [Phycisphaerales bacterium]
MKTLLLILSLTSSSALAQIAIRAEHVYTMKPTTKDGKPSYEVIDDGVIVIKDGKIAEVGSAATVDFPKDFKIITAAVATPGLIDARCTVGVSGIFNQSQDQDQLERSGPIQPELRAIDAYNPLDPLVEYVRSYGVTTIQTGHAPGEVVSGQLAIFKTAGNTVDEAVVVPESAIAVTLSPWAQKGGGKSPGTRAKMIAIMRDQLLKAQAYKEKLAKADKPDTANDEKKNSSSDAPAANAPASLDDQPKADDKSADAKSDKKEKDPPARDLRLEALVRVLDNKVPLIVTANRSQDIDNVLRLAEEFKLPIILDSASESYLFIDKLKARKTRVILHPTMARAYGELENKSFDTASKLINAGIPTTIQGGFESYVPKARVILFEAGVAAANGLTQQQALASITIEAAKILGVDNRVGSIEAGKDADVALYSGDPLEYTTTCTGVIINGKVVVEKGR